MRTEQTGRHGHSSAFVPHDIAAPIAGAAAGPLHGLCFAAKDMFDIAGERTGGGNPDWLAAQGPAERTSPVVQKLLGAGASLIGKTICDEFFFSIAGINAHYGMPQNPRAPGRLPGGSSSGSAAATAAGACDFALGSDTGGSVRVPAAFCGLAGIRPTHGRVDMGGVMAMAPSFDVVGWFAAAPGLLRHVGDVLLEGPARRAPVGRLLLAEDAAALATPMIQAAMRRVLLRARAELPAPESCLLAPAGFAPWREAFRVLQGHEVAACHGAWITEHQPRLGPGIAERIAYAMSVTDAQAAAANVVRQAATRHLRALVPPGTVLCLPTVPCPPPLESADAAELDDFRTRTMALTCPAGLAGLPQVTLPIATEDGLPAGLSLLGWPGSDEMLLDLACGLAQYCGV